MAYDFPDLFNPADCLKAPGNYHDRAEDVLKFSDEVEAIDWLWEKVTGWSLMETMLRPYTGHWENIFTLRDIWNNIGDAIAGVHGNLDGGAFALDPQWNGNAASAFEAYMSKMNLALVSEQEYAHYFADKLNITGEAFEVGVKALVFALNMVIDTLSLGNLKYFLFWREFVDDIKRMAELFEEVKGLKGEIEAVVDILKSLADAASRNIPDAPRVYSVPDESYGGPEKPGI